MKKLIITIFCALNLTAHSQIPIDIYVANVNCDYTITESYYSVTEHGNMTLLYVEHLLSQDIYHYEIQDTVASLFTVNVCLWVGSGSSQPQMQLDTCHHIADINSGMALIFIVNCPTVNIMEHTQFTTSKLIGIKNLLGQPIETAPNQIMIYTYEDGTFKKIYTVK